MTTGEALLRSVLCEPDDDTRRLAYADAIEENAGEVECPTCRGKKKVVRLPEKHGWTCPRCAGTGRVSDGRAERASFIRAQVELARTEPCESVGKWAKCNHVPECRNCTLRRRESELLLLCPLWFEVGADKTEWERGFVSGLAWNTEQFVRHAAAIFAAQPVTEVRLVDREPFPSNERPQGLFWREGVVDDERYTLPSPIFDELEWDAELSPDHLDGKYWPDMEQTRAALSRACVQYGRTLAHLPPLVTPAARPARVSVS